MIDATRLQQLAARLGGAARPSLPADLVPLIIAETHVGDAQAEAAKFIAGQFDQFTLRDGTLVMHDTAANVAARSGLLADVSRSLHASGFVLGWRNELLSVGKPAVAMIERAACRALGITTEAVHLNAYADSSSLFVARRAAHKQIDPGQWDNLVGGMVSAGESLQQALSREALEEAGLKIDFANVQQGRSFQMRRAVPEGVQSEMIHVFDMTLPTGVALNNQDGEVDAIECLSIERIISAIEHGEFTLEAALVVLESLTRRSGIEAPHGLFR